MYEYKFVKIEFGKLSGKPKENYKEVIKEHAREGWRFVQMLTPDLTINGVASYYELVFERTKG
ncbi:DUF4177 domain-containing protein [Neobacillus thermocopriae]|uniref:DUF4177 domain-containing protein n=1 Tax=Neobacillus thermocopriae TaxID=1215031 RepID=A0A6B3TPR4_9BACI|nr:DUF4177 domain-containing protein [Neobacillus thermocopriae]MED3623053.1 DUF4177 domain-containing protein [Neobacillus thermocopriae]MED3714948.1 DUF4177 domain-containing protein [Neobacillus thermocopriae]NEX78803.1 DUF4177 domain-containing protein [Neobacillus thermocopriae]